MSSVVEQNVELKVPVDGTYVSVVRLLISGLGTRLGLAVDEIENLKLVVGEAFLTLVEKCEQVTGLVNLHWRQAEEHIAISLTDPSGKHRSQTLANSANLALLARLGAEYKSTVVDGVEHLNIDLQVKYKDNRPFIFNERKTGRA
jgi:serine/threonine-protein kinase RsbW